MNVALEINAMSPTPAQGEAFAGLPEGPVVIVNLLKFKPEGGADEYAKYLSGARPLLEAIGARVVFSGHGGTCLVGSGDWDAVLLVEYPRPSALLQLVGSESYQTIAPHRQAGLEGQVAYAVIPNPDSE